MTTETDTVLIRRIAEKDRRAFEEVYERYHCRLLRFLLRFTRQPDLIEEIANDVMLVVWQKAADFRGRSRLSTWIFGIAYRTALKRLGRHRGHLEEPLPEPMVPDDTIRQDDALVSRELHTIVWKALGQLSPEHRAVMELTYYHGYSCREIAAIVDCPVNTVKTRMYHARRRLRKFLPRLDPDSRTAQNGGPAR